MSDTSGPAFPSGLVDPTAMVVQPINKGMTLRDYFASQAMNAIVMARQPLNNRAECAYVASHAYLMADALLEARLK